MSQKRRHTRGLLSPSPVRRGQQPTGTGGGVPSLGQLFPDAPAAASGTSNNAMMTMTIGGRARHRRSESPAYAYHRAMRNMASALEPEMDTDSNSSSEASGESTPPLEEPRSDGQYNFRITDMKKFGKELECGKCRQLVGNPPRLCESGHLSCQSCSSAASDKCCEPGCRHFVKRGPSNSVNRVLNSLLSLLETKCVNAGCNESIGFKDINAHAKACEFRAIECNLEHHTKCAGTLVELERYDQHLTLQHRSTSINGGNPFTFSVNLHETTAPRTLKYKGKTFIINICRYQETSVLIWISTVEPQTEALKFLANFKIKHKMDSKKLLEWSGRVHNVHTPTELVLVAGDCGLFHVAALSPYCLTSDAEQGTQIENMIKVELTLSKVDSDRGHRATTHDFTFEEHDRDTE